MTRRGIFVAGGVALAIGLSVVFVLPALQPRCQRWYHQVDFVAQRHVNGVGSGRAISSPMAWKAAVEDVRAKPFYCD